MCAADFDDVLEGVDFGLEGVAEVLERGQQGVLQLEHGGNVHDGREGVVGRGGHVDMVIRVDGLLGAHRAAQDLNRAVGDDLVGVHVGLRARTGLPDDQREVVEQLALGHLGRGLLDGRTDLGVQAIFHVDGGCRTLQDAKGLDHGGGHAVLGLVDVEVAEGAVEASPSIVYSGCEGVSHLTAGSGHPSTCPQGPRE